MTPEFSRAFAYILTVEGGYNASDGGTGIAVNMGVQQPNYDNYRRAKGAAVQPVRALTRDEAAELYERYYWGAGKCPQIVSSGGADVAVAHFDGCVNAGVVQAGKFLQRAILAAGASPGAIDGLIGPVTLAALSSVPRPAVLAALLQERADFYAQLISRNPSVYAQNKPAWDARLSRLRATVGAGAVQPPQQQPAPDDGDGGTGGGEGGGMGGVLALAAVGLLVVVGLIWWRRRRRR